MKADDTKTNQRNKLQHDLETDKVEDYNCKEWIAEMQMWGDRNIANITWWFQLK